MRHSGPDRGRRKTGWILMGVLAVLGMAGCPDRGGDGREAPIGKHGLSGKVILDWSEHTENALVVDSNNIDPLPATRVISMVHVAMHDAINAVDPKFETYAYAESDPSADPVAAAAAAAHWVLVSQFPAQTADLDARLAASLAAVPDGNAKTRGVALGQAVGSFIFELRANDGSAAVVPYAPGSGPGRYQFVTPYDGFINRPGWLAVTPWTLQSADQFRSPPPPALNSVEYATAYNEVKRIGAKTSSDRTIDETAYAKFWYENSDTGWNRITRTVTQSKGLDLHDSARLFALVNMAMADGFIAGWDAKFHYDFWRPYTAIRYAGGDDGNGETAPDPNWEPLMPTPPVQDHPSTHSVLGAAAATVLAEVLGDDTSFTFTSSTAERKMEETRSFTSFSQAAAENAESRVKAGIHFRFAIEAGMAMGKEIGGQAVATRLRLRK